MPLILNKSSLQLVVGWPGQHHIPNRGSAVTHTLPATSWGRTAERTGSFLHSLIPENERGIWKKKSNAETVIAFHKQTGTQLVWVIATFEVAITNPIPQSSSSAFSLCCQARHYVYVYIHLFHHFMSPVPAVSPLKLMITLWGESKQGKRKPRHHNHQEQPKRWCVINAVLATNREYRKM